MAIYPGISFKELVERTGSSEYEVERCLATFSGLQSYLLTFVRSIKKLQKEHGLFLLEGSRELKKYHDLCWRILLHNTVVVESGGSNRGASYKLSLFVIILVLAIVSYKHRYRLKHDLHYQNIPFADYYDKVAHNYGHKLPLIFGKWDLLKNILKLNSVYNLEILLDIQLRRHSSGVPVIHGGSREMVEGLKKIADYNSTSFLELYLNGRAVETGFSLPQQNGYPNVGTEGRRQNLSKDYLLDNDIDQRTEIDPNKIHSLRKKLGEIELVLQPLLVTHQYLGMFFYHI